MAKSVYLGNGNSHKVTKMYEGNGTAHKIKKGYIGDSSGKARLFFSGSTRWNRYTITKENQYEITQVPLPNAGAKIDLKDYCYYTEVNNIVNVINQDFDVYDGRKMTLIHPITDKISLDEMKQLIVGKAVLDYRTMYDNGIKFHGGGLVLCDDVRKTDIYYYEAVYHYNYLARITNVLYYQGNFIDTVESDNESAYPDNGISGNYWYVKIVE